ncbi:MAG: 1-hydroxycarotenoid 3,4-desaturase CrtD, partial [Pseudomonadota bacterium]
MSATSHVVVVGAGVGGLAAACDLSARGVAVTLLDRHAKPGGKMRQLSVGGAGIDSGPTVFTMRWIFDDLFAAMGENLDEHLGLAPVERLARHSWPDGSRLDLYADVERSIEAIAHFAGAGEAKAYRRFAAQSQRIFETLDHTFMQRHKPGPVELAFSLGLRGLPRLYATRPFTSLWRELSTVFSDPRLRQLFARYATYCGSSPFLAPATLMLIAHAERVGVWKVSGGMQRLAETLARLATDRGATLRLGAHVAQLAVSGGRITGVVLDGGETIAADAVVFNGDTAALARGLLGDDSQGAVAVRPQPSLSAMTWSLVARPSGFDLAHHNVFFGRDYEDEFECLFGSRSISDHPTVYVCAQDRGAGDALGAQPDGAERIFCLINAPARALSPNDIERGEAAMFALLKRQGLTLHDIDSASVRTTPADFATLFPATDGALYGRPTHGWNGSFARPGSSSANIAASPRSISLGDSARA